jgi:uncharacterized protein involved in exopolysaccharide biosynthesis
LKRYVATAYRGRWVYGLALIILLAATAIGAAFLSRGYEATGRIWVDRSTRIRVLEQQPRHFYTTPAEERGDMLYALMQTDSFMRAAISGTSIEQDLTGEPSRDGRVLDRVRDRLWGRVLGPNTLEIVYVGDDPVVAQRIVQNSMDEFRNWLYGLQQEQSVAEIEFYQEQVELQLAQVDDARQRLEGFAAQHPDPSPVSVEYLEFQRLQREYEAARTLYNASVVRLNDVMLVNTLSATYAAGEFRVIDEPTVPRYPIATIERQLRWAAPGVLASFGLVLIAIIFMTLQDRTVRMVDDVRALTNAPVVGIVPRLKHAKAPRGRKQKRNAVATTPASWTTVDSTAD